MPINANKEGKGILRKISKKETLSSLFQLVQNTVHSVLGKLVNLQLHVLQISGLTVSNIITMHYE